jgi:MYXO-CTERM domain-containing protein
MKNGMKLGVSAAVLATGFAVGGANAGIETQSVAIDFDLAGGGFGTNVAFQQFDTQGGTRVLEGVTVRFEGTLGLEATAQSYHDQFIASGSWLADVYHNTILSFNAMEGGDGGPSAPFYGLGGIAIINFTGDLTPGIPGSSPFDPGTPGDPVSASYMDSISSSVPTSAGSLSYYVGDDMVEGFFGPFTDILITDQPAGFVEVFASELTQVGTLSLDYEFSVVPAPAGFGVLAMGGLVAARRRRSWRR